MVQGVISDQISVAPLYLVFWQNMIVAAPCVREDLGQAPIRKADVVKG